MRRLLQLGIMALTVFLVIAIGVGVYVAGQRVNWRFDATTGKRHSLSPQTVHVLEGLAAPVHIVAFFRPTDPAKGYIEHLLDMYERGSKRVSVELVDPDKELFRARELGMKQSQTIVLLSGKKRQDLLAPDEEGVTSAIIRLTSHKEQKVYLLAGHGELVLDPTGLTRQESDGALTASILQSSLQAKGVGLESLTLANHREVPEDADLVLIAGAQNDLFDSELAALTAYVAKGGRIAIAVSAEKMTNIDQWLHQTTGMVRLYGMVVDPGAKAVTGSSLAPVILSYPNHAVTRSFDLISVMPTASAFRVVGGNGASPLGESAKNTWLETDMETLIKGNAEFDPEKDVAGPLWLAGAWEGEEKDKQSPRVVVFADQDFLSDRYVRLGGNQEFALTSLGWLLQGNDMVVVNREPGAESLLFLDETEQNIVTLVPMFGVPGVVLLIGVIVAVRRKRGVK